MLGLIVGALMVGLPCSPRVAGQDGATVALQVKATVPITLVRSQQGLVFGEELCLDTFMEVVPEIDDPLSRAQGLRDGYISELVDGEARQLGAGRWSSLLGGGSHNLRVRDGAKDCGACSPWDNARRRSELE